MHFLIDAQLPPALARWLSANGHEAQHVMDLDMMSATDQEIWTKAEQQNAIIITKDEDFVVLRNTTEESQPAVVWLRVGNSRKAELLSWFEKLLPQIISELERGEALIEVQ